MADPIFDPTYGEGRNLRAERRNEANRTRRNTLLMPWARSLVGKFKRRRRDFFRMPLNSPTYSFDTVKSTAAIGTPIPVIYGKNRVGGVIIKAFVTGSVVSATEQLNLLICVGWGQINTIAGQSSAFNNLAGSVLPLVNVNNNPAGDFNGMKFSGRLGLASPTVLPNTSELVATTSKASNLVTSVAQTHTTTTTPRFIEVTIRYPVGVFGLNKNGSYLVTVNITYSVARVSDAGVEDSGTFSLTHENAADFTVRFRTLELPATEDYIITLTRTTPAGIAGSIFSDSEWFDVNEFGGDILLHPNLALLEVTALASEQFNGSIPNFDLEVQGKFVPTWDGFTVTNAYSNNPAWCALDLLLDKNYGLGRSFTQAKIDLDSFKVWADYCDVVVDGQARITFNRVFDEPGLNAWDALLEITSLGHAIPVFSNNQLSITVDRDRAIDTFYGMGSILKGSFSIAYKQKTDTPDAIQLTYFNEANNFERDTVDINVAEPENGSYRTLQVTRLGITNQKQATHEARFILLDQNLVRRIVTLSLGPEGVNLIAGDRVAIAHDTPGWGYSGRALSVGTTTTFITDREVVLAGSDAVIIRPYDDDVLVEATVSSPGAGTYPSGTTITFTAAAANPIVAGSEWAVGTIPTFTVEDIEIDDDLNCSVELREYDANVYTTDVVSLETQVFSNLPKTGQAPTDLVNLAARAITRNKDDGTNITTLDVYWDYPAFSPTTGKPQAYIVEVFFKPDTETFWQQDKSVTKAPQSSASILNKLIPGVTYDITVVPVSFNGDKKTPDDTPSISLLFTGSTDRPATILPFTASDQMEFVMLSWGQLLDESTIQFYEIRRGHSWAHGEVVHQGLGNSLLTSKWHEGDLSYFIRAKSLANKFSSTATVATLTKSPLGTAQSGFTPFFDNRDNAWVAGTKTNCSVNSDGSLECDNTTGSYQLNTTTTAAPGDLWDIRVELLTAQVQKTGIVSDWTSATFNWDSANAEDYSFEGLIDTQNLTNVRCLIMTEFDAGWTEARELLNIPDHTSAIQFKVRLEFERTDSDYKIIVEECNVYVTVRP